MGRSHEARPDKQTGDLGTLQNDGKRLEFDPYELGFAAISLRSSTSRVSSVNLGHGLIRCLGVANLERLLSVAASIRQTQRGTGLTTFGFALTCGCGLGRGSGLGCGAPVVSRVVARVVLLVVVVRLVLLVLVTVVGLVLVKLVLLVLVKLLRLVVVKVVLLVVVMVVLLVVVMVVWLVVVTLVRLVVVIVVLLVVVTVVRLVEVRVVLPQIVLKSPLFKVFGCVPISLYEFFRR